MKTVFLSDIHVDINRKIMAAMNTPSAKTVNVTICKPANKCQAPKCGVQEKFRNIKKDMEKTPEMISPVKRQILNV